MDDGVKSRPPAPGACPEPESLSAHFDGAERLPKEQEAHVALCEKCGARLDDYGRIAKDMKCALASSTPCDVVARIRHGVKEKLERDSSASPASRRSIDFPLWLSRAAALLALCCVAGYFLFKGDGAGTPDGAKQPLSDVELASVHPSALKDAGIGPVATVQPGGAIDLSEISSVSFGGDEGRRLIAGSLPGSSAQTPEPIASNVRHVWISKSPDDVRAKVERIAKALSIEPGQISFEPSEDGLAASFKLDRRKAAMLVRACHASGFQLLSPQQPQPEQRLFSGSGSEPVLYEADFVSERK